MNGFHLIELLIVLTLIGILIALNVPIYSQHQIQENRMEAAGMLAKLAIAMEQYYIDQNTYQNATLSLLHFPELIAKNNYQLIIQSANDENYLLFAKPIHAQAEKDIACGILTLNALGEKSISGSGKMENCW